MLGCKDMLDLIPGLPSDSCFLDIDNDGPADTMEVYCDMDSPDGPWTWTYDTMQYTIHMVKLPIESNSPNGSHTFKDSSPAHHGVTPHGDVVHRTSTKKIGASSIAFDGSGDTSASQTMRTGTSAARSSPSTAG